MFCCHAVMPGIVDAGVRGWVPTGPWPGATGPVLAGPATVAAAISSGLTPAKLQCGRETDRQAARFRIAGRCRTRAWSLGAVRPPAEHLLPNVRRRSGGKGSTPGTSASGGDVRLGVDDRGCVLRMAREVSSARTGLARREQQRSRTTGNCQRSQRPDPSFPLGLMATWGTTAGTSFKPRIRCSR